MPLLDTEQIKEIIPHREPFLLIDEIIEMDENRIVGMKYVKEDEYYFQGHFPQEKVMPGVLRIEALAQVGAVAILSLPKNRGKIAYFAGIKDAKFPAKVTPGDTLRLEVILDRMGSRMGIGTGTAYLIDKAACLGDKAVHPDGKAASSNDKVTCQCQMMFMLERSISDSANHGA